MTFNLNWSWARGSREKQEYPTIGTQQYPGSIPAPALTLLSRLGDPQ